MKKRLAITRLLAFLLLVIIITACSDNEEVTNPHKTMPQSNSREKMIIRIQEMPELKKKQLRAIHLQISTWMLTLII